MAIQVAVVGAGQADGVLADTGEAVGKALASAGAIVVCGGLGGVMAAACRGAKSAGGLTVGFLPGTDQTEANDWVDVVLPTGMGEARNVLIVRSCQAVIAIGGEYGTLSEIAFALRAGTPVVGLDTWSLVRGDGRADSGIVRVRDPTTAASTALQLAAAARL